MAFLLPLVTFSQAALLLEDGNSEYMLTDNYVKVYTVEEAGFIKKILSEKDVYQTLSSEEDKKDSRLSSFWVQFRIKNNTRKGLKWVLEIPNFQIERIIYFDPRLDSVHYLGFFRDFDHRPLNHKNFVFDLQLDPGNEKEYYVKMTSRKPFDSNIKVRSLPFFISYSLQEYLLLGIFYGFLIIIMGYNTFMFFSLRDKAHLYYVLYVFAMGLRALLSDGLGFQFLWPEYPVLNKVMDIIVLPLLLVTFAVYSETFLELKKQFSQYSKILWVTVGIYLISYVISQFFPRSALLQIIYLIPFSTIYIISILVFRQGFKPARYFVIGYSLFIVGLFFYFLRDIDFIRVTNNFLHVSLVYMFNIGFVIEAFTFSVALADKIKIIKDDQVAAHKKNIVQLKENEELREKVNRELEAKVEERTKELKEKSELLDEAYKQLNKQAEEITEMNRVLDKENYQLKKDVQTLNRDRWMLKSVTYEQFQSVFPNEDACLKFLEELKWGEGYICKKCGNDHYFRGNTPFSRKCSKCLYDESVKSNTLFKNLKFPLHKAFYMVYFIIISEGKVSTYELSDKLELRQKTCWTFKKKVLETLEEKKVSFKELFEKGWSVLVS